MDDATKVVTAIFGGIIAVAIISVVVGRDSQAVAAIQATTSGLANIVGAAVKPQAGGASSGSGGVDSASGNIGAVVSRLNDNLSAFSGFGAALGSNLPAGY